jgi:hypothetical protein
MYSILQTYSFAYFKLQCVSIYSRRVGLDIQCSQSTIVNIGHRDIFYTL